MSVPSAVEIARRFVKYTPAREDRFEDGVRDPAKDWEKETSESEPNYEKGVTEAIKRKAFGKGVKRCGTARQQAKTILNLPRWTEGIQNSAADMAAAMEPVVRVLESVKYPQKYPKGDPRNYERVKAVGMALRKAKEEGRL